jgi:hypothetical protein
MERFRALYWNTIYYFISNWHGLYNIPFKKSLLKLEKQHEHMQQKSSFWDMKEFLLKWMTKVEITKDIHLEIWKVFDILWKTFCHSAISIKTNLQTWNFWTGQYVSYKSVNQFYIELAPPKWQNVFHIKCKKQHFTFATGYLLLDFPISQRCKPQIREQMSGPEIS